MLWHLSAIKMVMDITGTVEIATLVAVLIVMITMILYFLEQRNWPMVRIMTATEP